MRLSAKWFFWFAGIGVYVMFLGGIFYYNLFKWTFDEKLKQESIDMVRFYTPKLVEGLARNPAAITMDEMDTVSRFSKDDRVASLVYLNKYGDVRWYRDTSLWGKGFEDFTKQVSLPTDAIQQAWLAKTPIVRAVPNMQIYDIAIPLSLRGDVLGIIDLQVSRAGVVSVIDKAMNKYAIGAVGVLLLLGIPLYFFLYHYVLNPLLNLRDAIEAISFKNLELKFKGGQDEIGELAGAMGIFLSKVKTEIANSMAREKQRGLAETRWWESILKTVVTKNHRAIVVDEDNSVLYSNFPVVGIAAAADKLHLLDVIDSQQQDVLRLVSSALDRPNQVVEADTMFRSEPCHVKAVHLDEDGETKRTLILFEVKTAGVRI